MTECCFTVYRTHSSLRLLPSPLDLARSVGDKFSRSMETEPSFRCVTFAIRFHAHINILYPRHWPLVTVNPVSLPPHSMRHCYVHTSVQDFREPNRSSCITLHWTRNCRCSRELLVSITKILMSNSLETFSRYQCPKTCLGASSTVVVSQSTTKIFQCLPMTTLTCQVNGHPVHNHVTNLCSDVVTVV